MSVDRPTDETADPVAKVRAWLALVHRPHWGSLHLKDASTAAWLAENIDRLVQSRPEWADDHAWLHARAHAHMLHHAAELLSSASWLAMHWVETALATEPDAVSQTEQAANESLTSGAGEV